MFFNLLEFPCVRALLMSSGKTLSAFQGLDSMTHRRLDIVFLLLIKSLIYFKVHLCHRCASVQGMVATRTTPLHGPHMLTIQDLDQMSPLQLVSSYWFWAMNRDKGVTKWLKIVTDLSWHSEIFEGFWWLWWWWWIIWIYSIFSNQWWVSQKLRRLI